jgi:hypothetical protein
VAHGVVKAFKKKFHINTYQWISACYINIGQSRLQSKKYYQEQKRSFHICEFKRIYFLPFFKTYNNRAEEYRN